MNATRAIQTLVAALLAALWLIGAAGCNTGPKTSDKDILPPIDTKQLDAVLADAKRPAVLIDVRSHERFAQGHIPGAINIPLAELRPNEPRLANAQQIVVYAGGPGDVLSPAAYKKLLVFGYKNLHDYRGGLDMWKAEGREVEAAPADANTDTGAQ